ncbi:tail fiber domain-containing protein [Burkholderia multivorans]|uniref:tail fiber domain-containing protein n=1 Tax=Burkholderia multivorans TaxID=87883 RepID=UPI0021C0DA85|nr:tail fiber domain-containing protein [Burkholderia multivorans]
MTVNSSTQSVTYNCDGFTTAFPIPFYFLQDEDIHASLAQGDVGTDLVFGTDFNLTGAGLPGGGTLTMFVAPAVGYQLVIERQVAITQQREYQQNDPFPAKTTEKALDKLTMICQQISAIFGSGAPNQSRALLLGKYDVNGFGAYRANSNRITNLGDPQVDSDATNRRYVDSGDASVTAHSDAQDLVSRHYAEQLVAAVAPGAGTGSFMQDGIGAAVRTFQDKMRETVSVDDFFLAGAADDTIMVQRAIDAVSARGGGTILLLRAYIVSGIIGRSDVTLEGIAKNVAGLILASNASNHLINCGDYDINADGVNKSTPLGCAGFTLRNMFLDGNRGSQVAPLHCLAYYGTDLHLDNVEVKNALGWNIKTESPGNAHSVTRNLQSKWNNVEVWQGGQGNLYYNGQSDSNIVGLLAWYANVGDGAGATNVYFGPKASGVRVSHMHCWGTADYGCVIEAPASDFKHCHVESATVAKVYLKATTYWDGRVYEVGTATSAPAFLIDPGISSYWIRSTVSQCDTAIQYVGSDGGLANIELTMYSTNAAAKLFGGTTSSTNRIYARVTGAANASRFNVPNCINFDSTGAVQQFFTAGSNMGFYTDSARTLRQFGIEHTAGADSYVAVTGGGISGPTVLVRGPAGADRSVRLLALGSAGNVYFGGASAGPNADNVTSAGSASLRYSTIYAASSTINTSDENEKTDIDSIPDNVLDAWADVQFFSYRFKDSVEEKIDGARIHFGMIAQRVKAVFDAHNIDSSWYGILCLGQWPDRYEDVLDADGNPTGTQQLVQAADERWGVRYEEALILEAALQRRASQRLEARIAALEAKAA